MAPRQTASSVPLAIGRKVVILLFGIAVWSADAWAAVQGVVVEAGSGTGSSQVRRGDVITGWRCSNNSGPLKPGVELFLPNREERGPCTLYVQAFGLRGEQRRAWLLQQSSLKKLKLRPVLEQELLSKYAAAEGLAGLGNMPAASSLWNEVAAAVSDDSLKVCLHLHAAQIAADRNAWNNAAGQLELALKYKPQIRPELLAELYGERADVDYSMRQWPQATENYLRALHSAEQANAGKYVSSRFLNGAGSALLKVGDLILAESYFKRSLGELSSVAPESSRAATALNNLGSIAWQRGDLIRAERYLHQDQQITERLNPNDLDMAKSLGNFGALLLQRGELLRAQSYFLRALRITKSSRPESEDVAVCLHNLGILARDRGNLKLSEQRLREALRLKEALAPNSLSLANTESILGKLLVTRGNLTEAEQLFRLALEIRSRSAPDSLQLADSFSEMAGVFRRNHNAEETDKQLSNALQIWERVAPGSAGHADILATLAEVEKDKGSLNKAVEFCERALSAIEIQTLNLGGGDKAVSLFRAKHARIYETCVEISLLKSEPEKALEVLERFRAQSLREMLIAARIDVHRGVAPGLLRKEQVLTETIAAKSAERIKTFGDSRKDAEIGREISRLFTEKQELEADIRRLSPNYEFLMKPYVFSTRMLQSEILDPESVLLEYSLGEDVSHAWVLAKNSIHIVNLPGRATIEKAARELYDLLRARGLWLNGEDGYRRQLRIVRAERAVPQKARELSRIILEPIASYIAGKRLLIVGDGALLYTPFAMLPSPGNNVGLDPAPLVVDHEIVMLPSASTLAILRRFPRSNNDVSKSVAVLADPVFDRQDDRVKAIDVGGATPLRSVLTRSLSDIGLRGNGATRLPRLVFTRQEAKNILAATPPGSGMAALDFSASRMTATGPNLSKFRIVHFATHGILDSVRPELSGLVLTMVDKAGRFQDGFLRLEDIYNLKLGANLVVLSACETALGAEIRGEGIIGLTRGFMYAGASRVIASVWRVDDKATAELMSRLYVGMEQEGLRPAEALRSAQITMWKQQRWRFPFYWAAFRLEGEWR